jgi:hypothetical protein
MSAERPQAPVDEPQEDWEHAQRAYLAEGQPVIPWAATLDPWQRSELQADLDATEACACGHRDDEHDPDGICSHPNTDPDTDHACYAYTPVQR